MMAVLPETHTAIRRSKYEAAFLAVLPTGRENAITARRLGVLMGSYVGYVVGERTVRQVASDLRRRGTAICSAVREPYGFYRPTDADEAEEGMAHVFSREREARIIARACRATIRDMRRKEMAALIQALPGMEQGA
jgi:hypothetical protein